MSQNLTPVSPFVFGTAHFHPDFGEAKTINSDLFILDNLRDDSGPISSPKGYLVRRGDAIPLPSGEFAINPNMAIAEWDGNGYQVSNFSNTNHAIVRVVGVHTGPETSAFTMLYMVEVIQEDAYSKYTGVGNLYVVPKSLFVPFDTDYGFAIAITYTTGPGPIASSNGGW